MKRFLLSTAALTLFLVPASGSALPAESFGVGWIDEFGAGPHANSVEDLTVLPNGTIAAAGFVSGPLPGQVAFGFADAFLRIYDGAGNVLRTSQFGTGANDYAYAVAADQGGNVYVGGQTGGVLAPEGSQGGDAFLRKYTAAGTVAWTLQFGSPTEGNEAIRGLAVDEGGYVYAVGLGRFDETDRNAFVRKYHPNGALVWSRLFGPALPDGIAVDATGSAFVAGSYGIGADDYVFVRRYNASGTILWTTSHGPFSLARGRDVALDAHGNSYVAGYTTVSPHAFAGLVAKHDPAGNVLWTSSFQVGGPTLAYDVDVASTGAVIVAGAADGDSFVRKMDAAGNHLWSGTFGALGSDAAYAVAAGSFGAVFVAGKTQQVLSPPQSQVSDAYVARASYQYNVLLPGPSPFDWIGLEQVPAGRRGGGM